MPPAAPFTVVVRDAQPLQAPFAAVGEHAHMPNGHSAPDLQVAALLAVSCLQQGEGAGETDALA
jgi:hypothetical protein